MVVMVERPFSSHTHAHTHGPLFFLTNTDIWKSKFKVVLPFLLPSINKTLNRALQTKSLTTKSCEAEVCVGIFLKAKKKNPTYSVID